MMIRRVALPGVMALVMLVACSKPAPPPQAGEEDEDRGAAPPVEQAPRPDGPIEYDRDKMVSRLLGLIDTAPQCEQFRTQLQAASEETSGPLMRSDVDRMNAVVARAMEAGCYHKPQS